LRSELALAAVVLGVLAPTATAATTLNVIPHGQWEPGAPWGTAPGVLPAQTQAQMYDRLTPLFRDVTDAQLVPSTDGNLANSEHPQVINPSSGYIVNWNNKPAKDFPASDSRWNEQSIQRQELLTGELNRRRKQTLATVLAAANAAATEDVRVVELWPTLTKVLGKGKAPSSRARKLREILQRWHDAGGSRRDADHDGRIDDPGVPILDAAWKGLADAAMCDRLGTKLCNQLAGRNSRFDQPPANQYAGWHQYMWKDLRSLLGQQVKGAYHLRYCGDGKLSTCARDLWAALDAAGKRLASQQGRTPTRGGRRRPRSRSPSRRCR
jgi:acyl-homoserine lactone acylase PvdQ